MKEYNKSDKLRHNRKYKRYLEKLLKKLNTRIEEQQRNLYKSN
tara:strand:- start:5016 stop:5144 length:129 start_codon:yes stop_codon:yes gene_type:complete